MAIFYRSGRTGRNFLFKMTVLRIQKADLTGMKPGILDMEVRMMAKQGMKRPDRTHTQPRNQMSPVPELQGKVKTGKKTAKPVTEQ